MALDWIGRVQLGAVLCWEPHVRRHIHLGVVHKRCQPRHAGMDLIGDLAPLLAGRGHVIYGECRADPGSDDAALGLPHMSERVPFDIDATPLPSGAERLGDGGLQPRVRIRDHQLGAMQAAPREATLNAVQNGSDFHVDGVQLAIGQSPSIGRVRKAPTRSSISPQRRDAWLC